MPVWTRRTSPGKTLSADRPPIQQTSDLRWRPASFVILPMARGKAGMRAIRQPRTLAMRRPIQTSLMHERHSAWWHARYADPDSRWRRGVRREAKHVPHITYAVASGRSVRNPCVSCTCRHAPRRTKCNMAFIVAHRPAERAGAAVSARGAAGPCTRLRRWVYWWHARLRDDVPRFELTGGYL